MVKIAICDDELVAIDELVTKIQAYMKTKHTECEIWKFIDGESLLSHIGKSKNRFDAIYLDIKMKQVSGIEVAKVVRQTDNKTFIVFVSALKEYVFDAFDVNAMNFLIKPIIDSKLISTLDKIVIYHNYLINQFLIISTSKEMVKIPFPDIVYCEILNHRLFVYEKDHMHECSGKIDEIENKLSEDFFRCHRSYIVNLGFVEKYKDGFAYLSSMEKIPVATRRMTKFMKALLYFQRKEVR